MVAEAADRRGRMVPEDALQEVREALALGDDLLAAGLRVALEGTQDGLTATLRSADGLVLALPLALLADPAALRRVALGTAPPG